MATAKLNHIMAALFFVLAVVFNACTADDLDDTGRKSTSYAKSTENSNLSVDDYSRVATLNVTVTKTDAEGNTLAPMSGEANAKLSANIEQNPLQTVIMEKEFENPEITTSEVNGAQRVDFIIGINDGNKINGTINITKTSVYDNSYTLKVNAIEVDNANVTVVDTKTKSTAEKARQIVTVPIKATVESVGTAETHTGVIPASVQYETFQLKDDITIVDETATGKHTITDGKDDFVITFVTTWSDGSTTSQDFSYSAVHSFETIDHEAADVVKYNNWSVSKIYGIEAGNPAFVKEDGYFKEYTVQYLYSADHSEGTLTEKMVYMANVPQVVFTKGEVTFTFDAISPSFDETADELLDGTSERSGFELKYFRNAVTARYGNQETGVDTKVLEERKPLYKAEKAVSDIIFSNAKKTYSLNKIQYDVDVVKVYNDGTKSDVEHLTTSRPWSLTYLGYWSLVATGEVSQSTDAISMSKSSASDETQNIANGSWKVTKTSYSLSNSTTVDGQTKKNEWSAEVTTRMVLTYYGKTQDFGEDKPTAEAKDVAINKTDATATQETWKFTEMLNFVVGDYTEQSEGYGFVTKTIEKTLINKYFANQKIDVTNTQIFASIDLIKEFSDGSKETIHRDLTVNRVFRTVSYWESTEKTNAETTASPIISLINTEAQTSGDWKFNLETRRFVCGVSLDASNQEDIWEAVDANSISVTIEGETYTFDNLNASASNSASQSKDSETSEKTTYKHSNVLSYLFGGNTNSLTAFGLIFVNKANDPEGHDGFFPKDWGKIKGNKNIACLGKTRTTWGVGAAIEFENGSLPVFISKNGEIIIDKNLYQAGVHGAIGASYDNDGNLQLVTKAENQSNMMVWKNAKTVNFITYTDAKQIGFNWGNNHVESDRFASSIEQHDGGKYQVITFSGASYSVTLDSSY